MTTGTGGVFPHRESTGVWWRDHSLGIAVWLIFALHIGYDAWGTRAMRQHEAAGTTPSYALEWTHDLNESVGAEPWGVLIILYGSKWWRERGSVDSK